jgi:zinc and cadmium transporter
LSDLLPELQFHHHDRLKLTIALMLGLAVAYGVGHLESLLHRH